MLLILLFGYFSAIEAREVVVKQVQGNRVYLGSREEVKTRTFSHRKKNVIDYSINQALEQGQLTFILAKLAEQHLPKSLAFLPLIESHYTQQAISKKGAAGLWQLMPATAKSLGLTEEDRFNLNASTKGALIYLNQLHQKFGSWELAIAAYNAGENRVKRLLIKAPTLPIEELPLPQETKAYLAYFKSLQGRFREECL